MTIRKLMSQIACRLRQFLFRQRQTRYMKPLHYSEVNMESADLCIPIYLNQRIVFDLLAIIEDGFSRLSTIKTSMSEAESQKSGLGASIGVSNAFAFLGVSLKGEKGTEKGTEVQAEILREKVHTPTSLFSKLRSILKQRQLLIEIPTQEGSIEELKSGQFVEFRAVLRKNPLVDTIEGFRQLMDIAMLFTADQAKPAKGKRKGKQEKAARGQDSNQLIMQQLDGMLNALTKSNTVELIAEILGTSTVKAVLSAELDYFNDRNASEIIDGEFRVLGKVVRVIKSSSSETINLLRKTSFSKVQRKVFDNLANTFVGAEEVGVKFPELVTEIKGPALQVIPIAIFA